MITAKQQGRLLPLTTDDELHILRHAERILSALCPRCGHKDTPGQSLRRATIAIFELRSDGKAGGWYCTGCKRSGWWHKGQTLEEIGLEELPFPQWAIDHNKRLDMEGK